MYCWIAISSCEIIVIHKLYEYIIMQFDAILYCTQFKRNTSVFDQQDRPNTIEHFSWINSSKNREWQTAAHGIGTYMTLHGMLPLFALRMWIHYVIQIYNIKQTKREREIKANYCKAQSSGIASPSLWLRQKHYHELESVRNAHDFILVESLCVCVFVNLFCCLMSAITI